MNNFPTASDLNKALVYAGLDPAQATLTETSPVADLWSLSRTAGSTPAKVAELAGSL